MKCPDCKTELNGKNDCYVCGWDDGKKMQKKVFFKCDYCHGEFIWPSRTTPYFSHDENRIVRRSFRGNGVCRNCSTSESYLEDEAKHDVFAGPRKRAQQSAEYQKVKILSKNLTDHENKKQLFEILKQSISKITERELPYDKFKA